MLLVPRLTKFFTQLISETSGLSLADTLSLTAHAPQIEADAEAAQAVREFRDLLGRFHIDAAPIEALLGHDVARSLTDFFRGFPIPFRDEHVHLTGSLDADFIWPRLAELLDGPQRSMYEAKIAEGMDLLRCRSRTRRTSIGSFVLAMTIASTGISKFFTSRSSSSPRATHIERPHITWPAACIARRTSARSD
jgi:hypothetical protein